MYPTQNGLLLAVLNSDCDALVEQAFKKIDSVFNCPNNWFCFFICLSIKRRRTSNTVETTSEDDDDIGSIE
jgi:hypothetical protein